jgi:hypothetical protein
VGTRGAGEGGVEAGQGVVAVFADGVEVAADVEAVLGGVLAGETLGDLLLGFGGSQVAFVEVVGGPDPGVGGEAQDVGFAVAAEFEQVSPGSLFGGVFRAGDARDLGQAHPDSVPELAAQGVGRRCGDLGQAGVAGLVGGVDQTAQRALGLFGPVRAGIGFRGVGEVS